MSYPYPQDRHRDRKEKGDQPYKDAREAYAEAQADVASESAEGHDRYAGLTEEERNELQEREAAERLRAVGDEVRHDEG